MSTRLLNLLALSVALLVPSGMVIGDTPAETAAAGSSASATPDWVRIGQSRYSWNWLAEHCDKNRDGSVGQDEFPMSEVVFSRLDRTWDTKLTADDFDWSKEGALCRQKETTFALFKSVDKNSDGRLGPDEWQTLFAAMAKDKQYLNEEELERLIYLPRVVKTENETKLRTGNSEFSPGRMRVRTPVPQPGEMAPDFELRTADNSTTVKLSSFRGKKPVVLAFGCFTCGNYRTYSETVEELYKLWKDDVEFVRVYVREAHPVADERAATSTNALAGILFKQPTTLEERCDIAMKFTSAMHVTTPLLVDGIDNRVGQTYGAWPDRLYVVDRSGRIAFTGGPGPFGFNPREMEQSLAMMLLDEKQAK